ncbi:hypothetical protein BFC17_20410 [Alteromonas lipolytica]|uniref:DUF3718 domain-containing protein n=1 Tax=Alteromonas lipolytica TaxID=1856405 RepID=A0A1E8FEA6_9ALTE|nr:hypothetical protein BFC17_20410 [Alteromonas lipolytica]
MRSAWLAGSALLVAAGSVSSVQAAALDSHVESKLIAVCKAIKADSRIDLQRAVKDSGISYHRLADGLVCNGMDMYTFAMQHEAQSTGAIIARRTDLDERSLTARK